MFKKRLAYSIVFDQHHNHNAFGLPPVCPARPAPSPQPSRRRFGKLLDAIALPTELNSMHLTCAFGLWFDIEGMFSNAVEFYLQNV